MGWPVGRIVGGKMVVFFAATQPPEFQGGEGGCRDEVVAMFTRHGKAMEHDERGGGRGGRGGRAGSG